MKTLRLPFILQIICLVYLLPAQGTMHNEWVHYGSSFHDVDANGSDVTAAGDNIILNSTDAGNKWQEINFPYRSARLKHISKVGNGHYVAAGAFVYVTTNNGKDWTVLENMDGVLSMESFENTIIVTRDIEGARFMRSDDGGFTWVNLSTANVSQPSALDFVNKDDAYFSGDDGTIYYSSNGGFNWATINDTNFDQAIESLRFLNINEGYAQFENLVWRTIDSGLTWDQILDSSKASGGIIPLPSGLYTKSFSRFSIYENGSTRYIMDDDDIFASSSLDVAEANGKLFLSGPGMILIHDLANSLEEWEDLTPGPNDGFNIMASRGNKFIVSGGRRMQISNTNGEEFFEIDTDFSQLRDLDIAPDGTIYETQTALKRSNNDGIDWEFIMPSTDLVHVFDDGRIIAAGGSQLKLSTDEASTFDVVLENLSGFPVQLYFYDDNFGWYMNTSGTTYRSFDGGENWAEIIFPFGSAPSRMHFINNQIGFASGKLSSKFWKTTDRGTNWEEMFLSEAVDIADLYFTDEMEGYICGRFDNSEEGVVYKTTDGGNSWEVFQRGISLFWDIHFDESTQKMWVCGQKAQLYSYLPCENLKPTISIVNDRITCNESSEWYKWYLKDVFLVETKDPYIDIVDVGLYSVRIKGEGDCVSQSSEQIGENVNAVELLDSDLISIYPNPSINHITIELPRTLSIESISIYNLQGQEILRNKSNQSVYNISTLTQGNYFIKVNTSEGAVIKRLNKVD